jgi:hypothetical protein
VQTLVQELRRLPCVRRHRQLSYGYRPLAAVALRRVQALLTDYFSTRFCRRLPRVDSSSVTGRVRRPIGPFAFPFRPSSAAAHVIELRARGTSIPLHDPGGADVCGTVPETWTVGALYCTSGVRVRRVRRYRLHHCTVDSFIRSVVHSFIRSPRL